MGSITEIVQRAKGGRKLDHREVVRLYLTTDKHLCQIARELGACPSSIGEILNRYKVPRKPRWVPQPVHATAARDAIIAQRYPLEDTADLAREFGLRRRRICDIAREQGACKLVRRKQGHFEFAARRSARLRTAKPDYFRAWTPNMAWLLGYIWADGSLVLDRHERPLALKFECNVADVGLLQRIKSELEAIQPIRTVPAKTTRIKGHVANCGPCARLVISNLSLVESLIELHGLGPCKTYRNYPYPGNIPDELLGHFARGLFDGDGTISWAVNRKHHLHCCLIFLGSPRFLVGFHKAMCRSLSLPRRKIDRRQQHSWAVWWCGQDRLLKIYNWMYPAGNYIHLARKRRHFAELVEQIHERQAEKAAAYLSYEKLDRLRVELGSWQAVANQLDMAKGSVMNLYNERRREAEQAIKPPWRYFELTAEQLEALLRQHGTWVRVCEVTGISRMSLYRIRAHLGKLGSARTLLDAVY